MVSGDAVWRVLAPFSTLACGLGCIHKLVQMSIDKPASGCWCMWIVSIGDVVVVFSATDE